MALKAIITEQEFQGLNDTLKAEYTKQTDGTYLLSVTAVNDFALENVKGLKSALSAERSTKEELQNQLKAYEGLDAEKARDAIKKLEELGDLSKLPNEEKVRQQMESLKKQLTDVHTKVVGEKDAEIQSLTSQISKLLIDAEVSTILNQKETKGSVALLLPLIRDKVKVRKDQAGKFIVEVLDDNGNVRLSPATGSTGPMTIKELIQEMRNIPEYAPAFDGSGASGGGTPPNKNGGGAGGVNPWKKETFNLTEQCKITKENPQLAEQLKAQAGI